MTGRDESRSAPIAKADLRAGLAELRADIARLKAKLDAHMSMSSTRGLLGLVIALRLPMAARLFGAL